MARIIKSLILKIIRKLRNIYIAESKPLQQARCLHYKVIKIDTYKLIQQ